ncbi:Uncharacterised protein [Shigella sonnei]|nr:Uncharacterised protein [Shigella sonnei]
MQYPVIAHTAVFIYQLQRTILIERNLPESIFQNPFSVTFCRNHVARLIRFNIKRAIAHRRDNLVDLNIKLHKGIIIAIMNNLPID